MTAIGLAISNWLKARKGGPIRAESPEECYALAYNLFCAWLTHSKFTLSQFTDAIQRYGYEVVQRTNHATGKPSFLLMLPENFGSR